MPLLDFLFGNWKTPSYFADLEILPKGSKSKYPFQIFYSSKEGIALFQDLTAKRSMPQAMGNAIFWEDDDNEIYADAESVEIYPKTQKLPNTKIRINDLIAYHLYIESKQMFSQWSRSGFLEFAKPRFATDYFELYYGQYADSEVYDKSNFKDVQLGFSDDGGIKTFYTERDTRLIKTKQIEEGSFRDFNVIFHPNVKVFFNARKWSDF